MILVAIPYHQNKQYALPHLLEWLSKAHLGDCKILWNFDREEFGRDGGIRAIRREFIRQALTLYATHVFFVGADTIPPLDALPRLRAHNVDAVSGVYYSRENANLAVVWKREDNGWNQRVRLEQQNTLQRVNGFGLDCVLLSQIAYTHYLNLEGPGSDDGPFCEQLNAFWIPQYLDPTVVCKHYKDSETWN